MSCDNPIVTSLVHTIQKIFCTCKNYQQVQVNIKGSVTHILLKRSWDVPFQTVCTFSVYTQVPSSSSSAVQERIVGTHVNMTALSLMSGVFSEKLIEKFPVRNLKVHHCCHKIPPSVLSIHFI